jgi:hypothetical protein
MQLKNVKRLSLCLFGETDLWLLAIMTLIFQPRRLLEKHLMSDSDEEKQEFGWKDYVAMIIALLTTTLLPIVIIAIVMLVVAVILHLFLNVFLSLFVGASFLIFH